MTLGVTPVKTLRALAGRIGLALLVVALLISSLPAVSAGALQTGTRANPYRTELLDWSIVATGPNYILETVALEEYPHGRGERVYITSVDSLGFVEVSFFEDDDTPEETIDLMLSDFAAASDSLEVLDTGVEIGVHYALARFDLGESMFGYFYIEVAEDIEGEVDLAQSIYTLNADFLEQIELASDEISLDGLAFLSEPVIDLPEIIAEDTEVLASTPEPVATPQQGSFTFETDEAELVVSDSIEFDFPLTTNELEIMYLSSNHGYGVVGFIHQEADSAETVIESVFIGAPTGAEAPLELYLEADEHRALGVYRVQTEGETRAMIIEVITLDDGLWQVQAMAVTETEFASELAGYQDGVLFNGEPFLGEIDPEHIVTILEDN